MNRDVVHVAERHLLACVIRHPETFDVASDVVQVGDFLTPEHGAVWRAALTLTDRRERISVPALSAMSHPAVVSSVASELVLPMAAKELADAVALYSRARRVADAFRVGAVEIERASQEVLEEAIGIVVDAVARAADPREARTAVPLHAAMSRAVSEIEALMRNPRAVPGLSCGLGAVDDITKGWQRGHVYVIAAESGGFKSAFGVHCSAQAHLAEHARVLYATTEIPAKDIAKRILASYSSTPAEDIATGHLGPSAPERILRVVERFAAGADGYLLVDQPGLTMADVKRELRRAERAWGAGADLVVVDYAQQVRTAERHASREQAVAEIAEDLAWIAKAHECPVLAMAQLNREWTRRTTKRPQASDLRESSVLEHVASGILLLHRPVRHDESADPNLCEVIVAKHRVGRTGVAQVHLDPSTQRFADYERRFDGGYEGRTA